MKSAVTLHAPDPLPAGEPEVATVCRVATVLCSGAAPRDRALDALAELRRSVPFEAALLSVVHPLSGEHRPLVQVGYSERVASRLVSTAFHEEFIERFDMIVGRWPLRERDLPIDPLTLPSIAEYLTPAGHVEGMVAPLVDGDGRYCGCLFLSTADKRHPSDGARQVVGHLAPALTNLIDPRQSLQRLASTLDAGWACAGLALDGTPVPLRGHDEQRLRPNAALLDELTERVRRGERLPARFLWPAEHGRGWLRVRVERCRIDPAEPASCFAMVVAARPLDAEEALTRRELEVLSGLVAGDSNAAVASRLGVSPSTVKAHVEHILDKLGVPTRAAAAALAVGEGLVLLPPSAAGRLPA